ncbi:alpha,alpha-trehalase TreF [Solitalea koreensis]|uniref:Alpha,alpha-trehalase n=1 Tax=Solitalea koreensis TaxID=543615 RepID=A0A521BZW2_9SPHI|nr:alpha,alpha-trehalase TreF [Solitalea koreensis]SMO52121.1 alpha,alpha-trehalase [Solitalea koreensis]
MKKLLLVFIATLSLFWGGKTSAQINPVVEYEELFKAVQQGQIFSDQKKFVDCKPKFSPEVIRKKYLDQRGTSNFNLKQFVGQNFDTLFLDTADVLRHIDNLWSDLSRSDNPNAQTSSLIPLPKPYIVPGGRFREVYYWDSYFTMLGLQEAGRVELIENMIDNFAYLIEQYGHIPNGNRTYYLSRSQPPFFSLMVDLLAESKGDSIYIKYLPSLEKEYQFWMKGAEQLSAKKHAQGRVVRLDKNSILNRYWDDLAEPRPESYLMDVDAKSKTNTDSSIYRDIRAAAESGWDFSSRWFEDKASIKTIFTTQIIPVDLNCLLYQLETTLAKACRLAQRNDAKNYSDKAALRKAALQKYLWNEKDGYFVDYNFKTGQQNDNYTLAGVFPLFFNLADEKQASRLAERIKTDFLKDGGLVTTKIHTGEQWDAPNGWAPLQWIAYKGLKNYKEDALATTIAQRWINLNVKVFFDTNRMMEKYDVVDLNRIGGGGEYKLQDGFGWTNGVFLKLWNELKRK